MASSKLDLVFPNQPLIAGEGQPTFIAVVLDRSTSMGDVYTEAMDIYNEFLREQEALAGAAFITLITFCHEVTVALGPMNLKGAIPLTSKDYKLAGGTALNDAVIETITSLDEIEARFKILLPNGAKMALVIITDGWERSSRLYPGPQGTAYMRRLITEREKRKWLVLYHGIGMGKARVQNAARDMGINPFHASSSTREPKDLRGSSVLLSDAVSDFRSRQKEDE